MVDGPTAAYYDRHMENLASLQGNLRVLHFGPQRIPTVNAHPRIPHVKHITFGEGNASPLELLKWGRQAKRFLMGPTLIYSPYVSLLSFVVAAWKTLAPCRIYLRYTWRESYLARLMKEPLRKRLWKSVAERIALRTADWIGAGSERLAQWAVRHGVPRHRVKLTTNFVDTSGINRKLAYAINGPPRAVLVGRLDRIKRVEWAIRASRQLGFELHLFGDGPLRQALESISAGGSVFFHGRMPNSAIVSKHRDFDLYLHPSAAEAVPKALIEAMAAGLPCIGCGVDGVVDWLDNGRGVVTQDSPDAFAAGIRAALEDAPLRQRIGTAASDYARREHSPERALLADREWVAQALADLANG
jgi:glycosyltransferase involved in cell wall biosynthesis